MKLTRIAISTVTALAGLSLLVAPVLATGQEEPKIEQCGDQITSRALKEDFDGEKVDVDFQDYGISQFPSAILVTTEDGYKLIKVELDLFDGTLNNFSEYPVVNGVKFSPGKKIVAAKVTVEKDCVEVCPDPRAVNFQEPKEGESVGNQDICRFPASPSATPRVTELPNSGADSWMWIIGGIVLLGGGIALYQVRKKE